MNGVGGGSLSTSKIVIVGYPSLQMGPSGKARIDEGGGQGVSLRFSIDYTPLQIDPVTGVVDWNSGCSNLSAAVGAFTVNQLLTKEEREKLSKQLETVRANHRMQARRTSVVSTSTQGTDTELAEKILPVEVLIFLAGSTNQSGQWLTARFSVSVVDFTTYGVRSGLELVSLEGVAGRDPAVGVF